MESSRDPAFRYGESFSGNIAEDGVRSISQPPSPSRLGLEMLMNPHKTADYKGDNASEQSRKMSSLFHEEDTNEITVNKEQYDTTIHTPGQQSSIPFTYQRTSYDDKLPDEPRRAAYTPSLVSHGTDDVAAADYRASTEVPRFRTVEEILNAKRELLYKFDRLEKKGMILPRKFTLNSSYEDMKTEYERLKRDREVDNSVMFQRRVLLTTVSALEFVNNRFDPFDLKLEGWSENVSDHVDEYDDVFEELHDKYRGKGSMPPEIKLMMMVCGSAFMFHLTHTMFKAHLPQAEKVFAENPRLAKEFAAATAANMARNDTAGGGLAGMFSSMFAQPEMRPTATQRADTGPRMTGPGDLRDVFAMTEPDGASNHRRPVHDANARDDDKDSDKSSVNMGIEILSDIAESEHSDVTRFPDNDSIMVTKKRRGRPRATGSNVLNGVLTL
jgi:hypothetical protein